MLGGLGVVLLGVGLVGAWQHYNQPDPSISLVTIEDAEREFDAVAENTEELRFEISNGWDRPIRIVGLADC